jgi:hypothetical protein
MEKWPFLGTKQLGEGKGWSRQQVQPCGKPERKVVNGERRRKTGPLTFISLMVQHVHQQLYFSFHKQYSVCTATSYLCEKLCPFPKL